MVQRMYDEVVDKKDSARWKIVRDGTGRVRQTREWESVIH